MLTSGPSVKIWHVMLDFTASNDVGKLLREGKMGGSEMGQGSSPFPGAFLDLPFLGPFAGPKAQGLLDEGQIP